MNGLMVHGLPIIQKRVPQIVVLSCKNQTDMKVLMSFLLVVCAYGVKGQTADSADLLAEKIANRMRDSLGLTVSIRDSIFVINKQINSEKKEKMTSSGDYETVRKQIQQIENKRDSLYQAVLPTEKFLLYKQKKALLIRND